MKKNSYIELIISLIFVFFFIVYFLDFFSMSEYIIIRNPIRFKEPFVTLKPANVDSSFSLLDGVLPLKDVQTDGHLNSQTCYDTNFQSRLERTGNYLQRTNNYRHKDAESCTTPFQEFVNAYYKVEPLN